MNEPKPKFHTGDRVRLTYQTRTVVATVAVASANGKALGLCFEAVLGSYVGEMPVLWQDGEYRDLFRENIVELESY